MSKEIEMIRLLIEATCDCSCCYANEKCQKGSTCDVMLKSALDSMSEKDMDDYYYKLSEWMNKK